MIRQYENIQKCCYRESIEFLYNIEEGTKNLLIPKLIIQPLIENAIIHGADFQKNNAMVQLRIKLFENALNIVVWDNGTQANTDKINQYLIGEFSLSIKRTAWEFEMYMKDCKGFLRKMYL